MKMIPFGFSGGGEYIQSSEDTFFSVFRITYAKQFAWNCSRGYIALLFVISMTILISVLMERMMAGIVAVSFYGWDSRMVVAEKKTACHILG